MSVVSLTDYKDDGSSLGGTPQKGGVSHAISMRKENDTRRISAQHATKLAGVQPNVKGERPSTAPSPFSQIGVGAGDISGLKIKGKQRVKPVAEGSTPVAEEKEAGSPGTKGKGKTDTANKRDRERSGSPKAKDRRAQSPSKGSSSKKQSQRRDEEPGRRACSLSPSRPSTGPPRSRRNKLGAIDDSVHVDVFNDSLARRLAMTDVLTDRDQSALKLGRLVMETVMSAPDLSTDDSVSRFFFDNWLAKAGSTSQQADTYSIDLMAHMQSQIAQARAEAPFLLEGLEDEEEVGDDDTHEDDEGDEDEGEDQSDNSPQSKRAKAKVQVAFDDTGDVAIIDISSPLKPKPRFGMFEKVPKQTVKLLGEKVVFKTVGAVALEALDRAIIEFGKGNPILADVKSSLLPLMFADPHEVNKLSELPSAQTGADLDGSKYLGFQTWIEDAHLMYANAERAEHGKKMAMVRANGMEHEMKILSSQLKKEQARMAPLLLEKDSLRNARDEQEALKEQLREAMSLVEGDLVTERQEKEALRLEIIENERQNVLANKEVKGLQDIIDQMERDKLPDIRTEHAAALKNIEALKEENADLDQAIANFKVMLASSKERDTFAEEFLIPEAARVAKKIKELNKEGDAEGLDGIGKIHSAELSNDIYTSERRIYEPLHAFFSETSRAANSERYVEYLELRDRVQGAEVKLGIQTIHGLRDDLMTAATNLRVTTQRYEGQIKELKEKHIQELLEIEMKFKAQLEELTAKVTELESTVEEQAAEIVRLNEEWKVTRIALKKTKEELQEVYDQLQSAAETVKILEGEVKELKIELSDTKQELKETEEELEETKMKLAQAIIDLNSTGKKLKETELIVQERSNELGMTLADDRYMQKWDIEKKLRVRTEAKLKFSEVQIKNLHDDIKMLKAEVAELEADLAAEKYGRQVDLEEAEKMKTKLTSEISTLQEEKMALKQTLQLRVYRIEYLEACYEEECMKAADRYHRAEQTVDTLKGVIRDLYEDIRVLTDERNALVIDKQNLKMELDAMEERAIGAENDNTGKKSLLHWMDEELRACVHEVCKPKDSNHFDDMGASSVLLKRKQDEMSEEMHMQRVPHELRERSIDLIMFADTEMRNLAETFTDSMAKLENSLAVSREIIASTQTMRSNLESGGAQLAPAPAPAQGGGNIAASVPGPATSQSAAITRTMPMMSGVTDSGSVAGSLDGSSAPVLQMVPTGFELYNTSLYHLVSKETMLQNKENLLMLANDIHEMHSDKDELLHHVMTIHGYHPVEVVEGEEMVEGEGAGEDKGEILFESEELSLAEGGALTPQEQQDVYTRQVLASAAAAIETENPLRARVEAQLKEIIDLENELADYKLEHQEMELELKGTTKDLFKCERDKEKVTEDLSIMTDRFKQAMLAVEETERQVVRVKHEAAEGFKKKQETAHPAVKMQMMQKGPKGNPKRLVQPFLTFLRRNENEMSRQLGQQQIAMREVRGLCDRVYRALQEVQEEESHFYYRKHQNEASTEVLVSTMKKLWGLTRKISDDIADYTSWVFEGQEINLGFDKVAAKMRLDDGTFLNPAKAIGDNHLAGAYEKHSEIVKEKNEENDEESQINDEIRDDVSENAAVLAENLRHDSMKSGGWRMQMYNLDGSVDLDMPINDYAPDVQVTILSAKLEETKKRTAAEREGAQKRLATIKSSKEESDRKCDEIQDEILALQEEYGAKGIQHDFLVYKRIKSGIIDGSLAKHNLGEIIYSAKDFEDVEESVYKTVQTIVDLCREDGEPEKPQNPFATVSDGEANQQQESQVTSKSQSRSGKKRPTKGSTLLGSDEPMLKAEVIGEPGMPLGNMVMGPVGRKPASDRTNSKKRENTGFDLALIAPKTSKPSRSATSAPDSSWKTSVNTKKREVALKNFRAADQPARYGAYSSSTSVKRGVSDDSLFDGQQESDEGEHEDAFHRAIHHSDQKEPLEWSNKKSQDLVELLKLSLEKIHMRILYGKVIKPASPSRSGSPTQRNRPSTDGDNTAMVAETSRTPLKLAHSQTEDSAHSTIATSAMSEADRNELFGKEDDELPQKMQQGQQQQEVGEQQGNQAAVNAFESAFVDGAEPSIDDALRLAEDPNSDVAKFVSKLNAKVNKHITSAKLFESIVSELETTREKTGSLDFTTANRIYSLRTALPTGASAPSNGAKEGGGEMDSMMSKLKIHKPPGALTRSAHLVRDDHHHLVKEEKKERQYVNGPWGGRPHYVSGDPSHLSVPQAIEASMSVESRKSMGNLNGSFMMGTAPTALNSNTVIGIDPRFPDQSQFSLSRVSLSRQGKLVKKESVSDSYRNKMKDPTLNISLVPISRSPIQTRDQALDQWDIVEEQHRLQQEAYERNALLGYNAQDAGENEEYQDYIDLNAVPVANSDNDLNSLSPGGTRPSSPNVMLTMPAPATGSASSSVAEGLTINDSIVFGDSQQGFEDDDLSYNSHHSYRTSLSTGQEQIPALTNIMESNNGTQTPPPMGSGRSLTASIDSISSAPRLISPAPPSPLQTSYKKI